MKSVLYGLLLAFLPELAAMRQGMCRLSSASSMPLQVDIRFRFEGALLCALNFETGLQLLLYVDLAEHIARPLHATESGVFHLAGDSEGAIDVAEEMHLASLSIGLLSSVCQAEHSGVRGCLKPS